MKKQEKLKLIVDTDPGVDDVAALMYAFFEDKFDIKLLTTNSGNRPIEITTRNTLHLLEKYGLDMQLTFTALKEWAHICHKNQNI